MTRHGNKESNTTYIKGIDTATHVYLRQGGRSLIWYGGPVQIDPKATAQAKILRGILWFNKQTHV